MRYFVLLTVALFAIVALVAQPAYAERYRTDTPPPPGDPSLTNRLNHWHVSTYWAEYIEGHGLGNHALYCGDETIPACAPPDTIGGVGRDWLDEVEWRYSVADTSQPVTVHLTGLMIYDLPDAFWDFLELYIRRGDQVEQLESWTGVTDTTVNLDFTSVLYPGEFTGPQSDEIVIFWRVWTSADGWDDEDCINPSHGACQIDDLAVYVDGALITFDDFEPGNPVNWNPAANVATAEEDVPGIGQVTVAAHPNPFNPQTTISFDLPQAMEVSLAVFDLQGRLVRNLLQSNPHTAGSHHQVWDGRDAEGQAAASGVYFFRFTAGDQDRVGKLTLLK